MLNMQEQQLNSTCIHNTSEPDFLNLFTSVETLKYCLSPGECLLNSLKDSTKNNPYIVVVSGKNDPLIVVVSGKNAPLIMVVSGKN